jgi:hypothetical protein
MIKIPSSLDLLVEARKTNAQKMKDSFDASMADDNESKSNNKPVGKNPTVFSVPIKSATKPASTKKPPLMSIGDVVAREKQKRQDNYADHIKPSTDLPKPPPPPKGYSVNTSGTKPQVATDYASAKKIMSHNNASATGVDHNIMKQINKSNTTPDPNSVSTEIHKERILRDNKAKLFNNPHHINVPDTNPKGYGVHSGNTDVKPVEVKSGTNTTYDSSFNNGVAGNKSTKVLKKSGSLPPRSLPDFNMMSGRNKMQADKDAKTAADKAASRAASRAASKKSNAETYMKVKKALSPHFKKLANRNIWQRDIKPGISSVINVFKR